MRAAVALVKARREDAERARREAIRQAEAEAAAKAQEEAIRREATIMAEAWKAAGIAGPGSAVVNVAIHETKGSVTELEADQAAGEA